MALVPRLAAGPPNLRRLASGSAVTTRIYVTNSSQPFVEVTEGPAVVASLLANAREHGREAEFAEARQVGRVTEEAGKIYVNPHRVVMYRPARPA